MCKKIFLGVLILFSMQTGFAQVKNSPQLKPAKDYIKHKEETDPNMNRLGRDDKKTVLITPADTGHKKNNCSKNCPSGKATCKANCKKSCLKIKGKKDVCNRQPRKTGNTCTHEQCKNANQKAPAAKDVLPDRNTRDPKIDSLVKPVDQVILPRN